MNFKDFGLDLGNPDFPLFAESFGVAGFKVKEGDNLTDILDSAFSLNTVAVIECPIDYSVNYETFSIELKEIGCNYRSLNI